MNKDFIQHLIDEEFLTKEMFEAIIQLNKFEEWAVSNKVISYDLYDKVKEEFELIHQEIGKIICGKILAREEE